MSKARKQQPDEKTACRLRGWHYLQRDWKQYRLGVLAAVVFVIAMQWLLGGVCLSVRLAGLPCPACGLTRAGIAVCTLHFKEAWWMNAMIYPIILFVLYFVVCRYILGKTVKGWRILLWVMLAGLLFYYIYRMWQYFPQGMADGRNPIVYGKQNLFQELWEKAMQQ